MKRMIAILLVLVMTLGLAACGAQPKESDKEPATINSGSSETTTPGTEDATGQATQPARQEELLYTKYVDFWGMKIVEMPQIPELTWEEKPFGATTVNIATTPFTFDTDQIYAGLKENEYVRSLYGEFVASYSESNEGEYYTDIGEQLAYGKSVTFKADLKNAEYYSLKTVNDFSAYFYRSTADYANYHSASLTFTFENKDQIDQAQIYEVAKLVFGEQYAEALVYGLDSREKPNLEKVGYVTRATLEEQIQSGDCVYYLEREVDEHRHEIVVKFKLGVEYNPNANVFVTCYGQDDTSMYPQMKYTVADVMSEGVGGTDPLTFHDFADAYFREFYPTYSYTIPEIMDFSVYESESGKVGYRYWLSMKGGCTDISKVISPKLNMELYIEEENDRISVMDFVVENEVTFFAGSEKKTGQDYLNTVLAMMNTLYPQLDLSGLQYNENDDACEMDVSMDVMGISLTGTAKVVYGDSCQIELKMD